MNSSNTLLQVDVSFKIIWHDSSAQSFFSLPEGDVLIGKSVVDTLGVKNTYTTSFYRWMISDETQEEFEFKVEDNEIVHTCLAWKTGENIYLKISKKSETERGFDFGEIFWRVFTQSFPGGLLFVGPNFEIAEMSHSMLEFLRLKDKSGISISKKSLIGKSILTVLRDNNYHALAEEFEACLSKALEQSNIVESPSLILHNKEYFQAYTCSIREKGRNRGFCIYLFNKTQEFNKDKQIEAQRENLFYSAKLASLGEMAGGIAHEINNPLAILMSTTYILKKALNADILKKEKAIECADDIEKTIIRINKIVIGMRNISHSQNDEEYQLVSLNEILEDVLCISTEKIKNSGILISTDWQNPDLDIAISCHRVLLSQVLLNLINNSIDAVQKLDEKWIKIVVDFSNDLNRIMVIDSGKGIDQALQQKIFQPFFTTKDIGKGTGLGLSISNTLVQKQNGKLYVDTSNSNTCFVIELKR